MRYKTGLLCVEGGVRAENAQLLKKIDEAKLSMFNKVYHTFLLNPVKINKPELRNYELRN